MQEIQVQIERFVSDDQPGWVECALLDATGRFHKFIEKVPVVSIDMLTADSAYPLSGVIGCEVVKQWMDKEGRQLYRVDTSKPWGIESKDGETQFDVFSSQIMSGV